MSKYYEFFHGHKVSKYGIENGFVDYRTLSNLFDCVLCNNVTKYELELVNGSDFDEETEEYSEFYQYYIIDESGYRILSDTDEVVYYCEDLDVYVWAISHFGTSWDYVLTDIPLTTKVVEE